MGSDFRRLLSTRCWECVIDVVGWRDEPEPGRGWVNVGLISNHDVAHFHSWRGRWDRICQALAGEDYPFLEFFQPEDIDEFITALRKASAVVFGEPPASDRSE